MWGTVARKTDAMRTEVRRLTTRRRVNLAALARLAHGHMNPYRPQGTGSPCCTNPQSRRLRGQVN
jgi:hypothetical protein